MVTFWLLIDTIAMIGSPASRGAAPSVVCSGGAWRGAAPAGGAAVSAVRAAVAASVTIAGGAHRRTTSVDWAVVRFVMPCPGCQGGIASKQTLRTGEPYTTRVGPRSLSIWLCMTRPLTAFLDRRDAADGSQHFCRASGKIGSNTAPTALFRFCWLAVDGLMAPARNAADGIRTSDWLQEQIFPIVLELPQG